MSGLLILSTVLGSLAGLLTLIGTVMAVSEKWVGKATAVIRQKRIVKKLKRNRKMLKLIAKEENEIDTKTDIGGSSDTNYLAK
jgi:hypothetical protein